MVTTHVEPMEGPAFGEGVVNREEVLERYRCLREISRTHGGQVLKAIPRKVLLDWGKRLGLSLGKLHEGLAPGHLRYFDRKSLRALFGSEARIRLDWFSLGYYVEATV